MMCQHANKNITISPPDSRHMFSEVMAVELFCKPFSLCYITHGYNELRGIAIVKHLILLSMHIFTLIMSQTDSTSWRACIPFYSFIFIAAPHNMVGHGPLNLFQRNSSLSGQANSWCLIRVILSPCWAIWLAVWDIWLAVWAWSIQKAVCCLLLSLDLWVWLELQISSEGQHSVGWS